jgi:hypothetical protein
VTTFEGVTELMTLLLYAYSLLINKCIHPLNVISVLIFMYIIFCVDSVSIDLMYVYVSACMSSSSVLFMYIFLLCVYICFV